MCFAQKKSKQLLEDARLPYKDFIEQIIDNCIAIVACQDGVAVLHTQSGIPPGLTCATQVFNKVYEEALTKYTEAIAETTCLLHVKSVDPANTQTQSAATSTFVDDIATTYVSPMPNGLNDAALLGTLELDHAILQIDMKQNLEKAQSIAQCRGKGARIA